MLDMRFSWDKQSHKVSKLRLAKAQRYIDKECITKMTPYVPVAPEKIRNSGRLKNSVRNPKPGSIIYTAPLARYGYYARVNHKHGGNPQGRRKWFEVMKTKHKEEIGKGASKIIGAKLE